MRAVWSDERIRAADREARAVSEEGGDGAKAFAEALSVLDVEELEVDCAEARRLASSCGCWRCRGDRVFAGAWDDPDGVCCPCGAAFEVTVAGERLCAECADAVLRELKAVGADG